eukprot:879932-Rhodomonas_salina.1
MTCAPLFASLGYKAVCDDEMRCRLGLAPADELTVTWAECSVCGKERVRAAISPLRFALWLGIFMDGQSGIGVGPLCVSSSVMVVFKRRVE